MFAKITPGGIIRDHIATLHAYNSSKTALTDILLFFVLPAPLAALLVACGLTLKGTAVGILLSAFAIFAGLLLNLLVLIHSVVLRMPREERNSDRYVLLREVYANISYAVFISLLAVIVLCVAPIGGSWSWLVSGAAYYIMVNFMLTLFMVLKRVHIMLEGEFVIHQ